MSIKRNEVVTALFSDGMRELTEAMAMDDSSRITANRLQTYHRLRKAIGHARQSGKTHISASYFRQQLETIERISVLSVPEQLILNAVQRCHPKRVGVKVRTNNQRYITPRSPGKSVVS